MHFILQQSTQKAFHIDFLRVGVSLSCRYRELHIINEQLVTECHLSVANRSQWSIFNKHFFLNCFLKKSLTL